MAEGQLRQFMDAIAAIESGGTEDPYRARGPAEHPKYGRAMGRYQIMSGIWKGWAAEIGYGGLSHNDFLNNPHVQDAIAAHKMNQYYQKYGRWDLVAAAWFGGEGAANAIRDQGMQAVANRNDGFTSVPDYVSKVMGKFGHAPSSEMTGNPADQAMINSAQAPVNPASTRSPQRNTVQAMMNRLSGMIQDNPGDPQMHEAVRKAMQEIMGADAGPTSATASSAEVQQQVRAATESQPSPAPEWPSGDGPPTETGGIGQSGVR